MCIQYHIESSLTLELLLGKQTSLLDPTVRLFVGNMQLVSRSRLLVQFAWFAGEDQDDSRRSCLFGKEPILLLLAM